jgi:hypothetical protein
MIGDFHGVDRRAFLGRLNLQRHFGHRRLRRRGGLLHCPFGKEECDQENQDRVEEKGKKKRDGKALFVLF